MTFICPICKEIASSKHPKYILRKKGKNWREKSKERAKYEVGSLGELAFYCPCCHESRSLAIHNPFDDFSKHGKSFRPNSKKKLKRLTTPAKPRDKVNVEVTTMTHQGLAETFGFTPEDVQRAGFRVRQKPSASVSWDDATEMRRLILKDMVMQAALEPLLVLQCAFRCWRSKFRVKKIREAKEEEAKKKKKRKPRMSYIPSDLEVK